MLMVRELTDSEILDLAEDHRTYTNYCMNTFEEFNAVSFARALFEFARVQQNQNIKPMG